MAAVSTRLRLPSQRLLLSLIAVAALAWLPGCAARRLRHAAPTHLPFRLGDLTEEETNQVSNYSMSLSEAVYHEGVDVLFPGAWFANSKCLVHERNGTLFVAFRGTKGSSFDDMMVDLKSGKLYPHGQEGGYVHKGFYERASADWGESVRQPTSLSASDTILGMIQASGAARVVFTGHSLGAGAALMAALRALDAPSQKKPVLLVTFGLPLSASKEIGASMKKSPPSSFAALNFVIRKDPLADIFNYFFLPSMNYFPVGPYVFLDDVVKGDFELISSETQVLEKLDKSLDLDIGKHHHSVLYLELIEYITSH